MTTFTRKKMGQTTKVVCIDTKCKKKMENERRSPSNVNLRDINYLMDDILTVPKKP